MLLYCIAIPMQSKHTFRASAVLGSFVTQTRLTSVPSVLAAGGFHGIEVLFIIRQDVDIQIDGKATQRRFRLSYAEVYPSFSSYRFP